MKKPFFYRRELQILIDLYRSEGINVYEVSSVEIFCHPWNVSSECKIQGMYQPSKPPVAVGFGKIIKNRSIVLRKNLPNYQKFLVLLHERGHDICFQSGCKCSLRLNLTLTEVHAWRHVLSTLLQRKLWSLLRTSMMGLRTFPNVKYMEAGYFESRAAKIVKKSALWRQCVQILPGGHAV